MKIYGRCGDKLFGLWFDNKSRLTIDLYKTEKVKLGISNKDSDEVVGLIDVYLLWVKLTIAYFKKDVKC